MRVCMRFGAAKPCLLSDKADVCVRFATKLVEWVAMDFGLV